MNVVGRLATRLGPADRRRMSLARVLLALLVRRAGHGYRLRARVPVELGLPPVEEPSHVYAALAALERAGLVRCDGETAERGKRSYAATAAGCAHVEAWLDRPLADRSLLRRPLLLKAAVWLHLGAWPSARVLRAERTARLRRLAARLEPPPVPLADVLRERTRRHLEIELWLLDRLASERPVSAGGVRRGPQPERDRGTSSRPPGSASR